MRAQKRTGRRGGKAARHASRGLLRKAFTHVGLICNDPSLQPKLPHILLLNTNTATRRDLVGWKALKGCSAEVWRGKSAWINTTVFKRVIERLGVFLRTHAPERQAILLMDAHGVHCSEVVMAAARAANIWTCIVPASTTSLLQPLDTHVFARYKLFLRQRLQRQLMSGDNKDIHVTQVLEALMEAMKGVLQRHEWAPVFEQNGFGEVFVVRQSLLTLLEWKEIPQITAELPSFSQFKNCFPKNRAIPFTQMLAPLLPQEQRAKREVPAAGPHSVAATIARETWRQRLRPRVAGKVAKAKPKATRGTLLAPLAPTPPPALPPRKLVATTPSGRVLHSVKRLPSRTGHYPHIPL